MRPLRPNLSLRPLTSPAVSAASSWKRRTPASFSRFCISGSIPRMRVRSSLGPAPPWSGLTGAPEPLDTEMDEIGGATGAGAGGAAGAGAEAAAGGAVAFGGAVEPTTVGPGHTRSPVAGAGGAFATGAGAGAAAGAGAGRDAAAGAAWAD